MADEYLGYRDGDADTPFGKFLEPDMAPLPRHVTEALEHGPQAGPTLLAFDDAPSLDNEGYQQTENGYRVLADGTVQVSVRTDMPGITPTMWSGGSAGTAATHGATSCGTRGRIFRRHGRTATTPAENTRRVMSGGRR